MSTTTPTAEQIHAGLRAWAKGLYNTMSAVEFLIACGEVNRLGVFIRVDADGWMWLDFTDEERLDQDLGGMSSGEKATWRLAYGLVRGQLGHDLWTMDPDRRRAFLRAVTYPAGPTIGTSAIERARRRIDRRGPDEHWLWSGNVVAGLPMVRDGRSRVSVRRLVMAEATGAPVPRTRHVHVTCGVALCLNPAHLTMLKDA